MEIYGECSPARRHVGTGGPPSEQLRPEDRAGTAGDVAEASLLCPVRVILTGCVMEEGAVVRGAEGAAGVWRLLRARIAVRVITVLRNWGGGGGGVVAEGWCGRSGSKSSFSGNKAVCNSTFPLHNKGFCVKNVHSLYKVCFQTPRTSELEDFLVASV